VNGRRLAGLVAALASLVPFAAGAAHVNAVTIDGSINPASSEYIQHVISLSESDGAVAALIELDTPGGLLASTQDIVQAMLNARVPVIVFVSPQGAWAASAGAFVTLAAHIAAMAPGTSIGSASPVSASGEGGDRTDEGVRRDVGAEKAEKFTTSFIESIARERKRNVEWAARAVREAEAIGGEQALELGVIDLVARDVDALFEQLDGREVDVNGELRVLTLADVEVRRIEMSTLMRIFNVLADPNVAMLLALAGFLGLYMEFNQPGMIVPGVLGLICLVLAGYAFQILPFSWVGLLVLALGVGLVAAELYVPAYGALFAAGLACLLIGGSMVFDVPEVSDLNVAFWPVLVPVVSAFAVFAAVVIFLVGRTFLLPQTAGVDELIGATGRAVSDLDPNGKVFIHGEYWRATASSRVAAGEAVEVVAVQGLRLRVRAAPGSV